jgi:2-polyprenyl-3-methyl-5-hydroxy-6-metoxy-1,4-benzoquinol methylase
MVNAISARISVACPRCGGESKNFLPLLHTHVYACSGKACGLKFAFPQMEDERLAEAYRRLYYPSSSGEEVIYENTPVEILEQTFARFEKIAGPLAHRRVLDFGSGIGGLCKVAQATGMSAVGIEADPEGRRTAAATTGLVVYASISELKAAEPDAKFDLITMWDVIEHLRKPWEVIAQLRPFLREDGWFLLSTPNAASLRAYVQKAKWENFKNETHFYYFTASTLESVLNGAGLSHVRFLDFPIRYPFHSKVRALLNQALTPLGRQGQLIAVARPGAALHISDDVQENSRPLKRLKGGSHVDAHSG